MRLFFTSLLFILLSTDIFAQAMTQNCISALEFIKSGYVIHGVEDLKKLANTNSMEAQFFIAVCYEKGIGVQQNQTEAFKYCRKAAERGLPDAMYMLANYYKSGSVVNSSQQKYEEWIARFNKKGGNLTLPDIYAIYNEGINHPENYSMNPSGGSSSQNNGTLLAIQNNGNINSNNTIGSNNQTVNNITIIQAVQPQVQAQPQAQQTQVQQSHKPKSDVDQNIPTCIQNNDNTFAVIIANENYQDVAKVSNAMNDGDVFAEYCMKVIGLPETNVTLVKDATLNNIKREISKLSKIADAYKGTAKIIFYYAGHGIPDEATKDAFLLPVDGYGTDTSTGYSLRELYSTLGKMPTEQIVVLLDACFSGTQRGDGMLASARGVAIKTKPNKAEGKMVILSAAQSDETAYPYEEQGHGLFTYYLLKKLKETQGNVTLGDLASYIKDNVSKKSIVVNGKSQTPSANPSVSLGECWKNWTLK